MSLVLVAQTPDEIAMQVAAGLRQGFAVEIMNEFRYCPVEWIPGGPRGWCLEEMGRELAVQFEERRQENLVRTLARPTAPTSPATPTTTRDVNSE